MTEIKDPAKELSKSPVFAMSLGSKELFHSNFWQWLITADTQFATVFFPEISYEQIEKVTREEGKRDLTIHMEPGETDVQQRNGRIRQTQVIDVYIIENKLKSIPTVEQLEGYQAELSTEYVFRGGLLTGIDKPQFRLPDGWVFLSYADIAKGIEDVLSKSKTVTDNHRVIITEYLEMLRYLNAYLNKVSTKTDNRFPGNRTDVDVYKEASELRIRDLCEKRKALAFVKYMKERAEWTRLKESIEPASGLSLRGTVEYHRSKVVADFRFSYKEGEPDGFAIVIEIQGGTYSRGAEYYPGNSTNDTIRKAWFNKFKNNYAWFYELAQAGRDRSVNSKSTTMTKPFCKFEGEKSIVNANNERTKINYCYIYQHTLINQDSDNDFNFEALATRVLSDLERAQEIIEDSDLVKAEGQLGSVQY